MCINIIIIYCSSSLHLSKAGLRASTMHARRTLLYIIPRPIKGSYDNTDLQANIFQSHLIDPLYIPCDFWFDSIPLMCAFWWAHSNVSAFSWMICWWFYDSTNLTWSCPSHNSRLLIPWIIHTEYPHWWSITLNLVFDRTFFCKRRNQHSHVHHHTHYMLKIRRGVSVAEDYWDTIICFLHF